MLSGRITQLAPPPRHVPLAVECKTALGLLGSLGAIFMLTGMFSVWMIAGDVNPLDEWRLARSTTTAQATVTRIFETNVEVNDEPMYGYEFTFRTPDEKTITARSYSRGQIWSKDEHVTAWYVPGDPGVARLEHTSLSATPLWVVPFLFIFPLSGLGLFATSTLNGLRQARLLRCGEITGAHILDQQPTGTEINDVPVMRYTYEFRAQDGLSHTGACKSLPSQHIGDEEQEPVLYLPSNPKLSVLVDALPLRHPLTIDSSGQWESREGRWPVVLYGLIWAGIFANVLYAVWRLASSWSL